MGPWREVFKREAGAFTSIAEELRGLTDSDARRSSVLVLDSSEDPHQATAALAHAFDDPDVTELRVFNIGDGEAMSGLLIAGRRGRNGDTTFLVVLMD